MVAKPRQYVSGGEVDTSTPFASVKVAVSLFGERSHSAEKLTLKKPNPPVLENTRELSDLTTSPCPTASQKANALHDSVSRFASTTNREIQSSQQDPDANAPSPKMRGVSKETQLHLAKKELNKYKEQLENAEATKAQALSELEKAQETVNDLTNRLISTNKSKESVVNATEEVRFHAKELEAAIPDSPMISETPRQSELADARERYSSVMTDLDEGKQDLRRIRREFSALTDAKASAAQQETEATQAIAANKERAHELMEEIAAACDSLVQVKHAYMQTLEEHGDILKYAESSFKADAQEAQLKLEALRKEIHTNGDGDIEGKLLETVAEVRNLQEQLDSVKPSQLNSLTNITTEMSEAKGTLHKVLEEKQAQRDLLESLKMELGHVKEQDQALREKEAEAEAETVAQELHAKLQSARAELDAALTAEAKSKAASAELVPTIKELAVECEEAKLEANKMRKEAKALKREAETARIALEEAEEKLKVVLREADEAKAAESSALHQIRLLSEKMNVARASPSEPDTNITISTQEYESLSKKVNDAAAVAGMKESAAKALVEAIRMSEREALRKLESIGKEIEKIKNATEEAFKKAEMAEAAKIAIEGELRKRRERENRRWSSAERTTLSSVNQKECDLNRLSDAGPATEAIHICCRQNVVKTRRKLEASSSFKKKMLSTLGSAFRRRKNQVAVGLPPFIGEKAT